MSDPFEGWAIVEIMGHRRLAGMVTEQDIAGQAFLRLDIPAETGDGITQFYSPSSVYCLTPTTEDIARKVGAKLQPQPVSRFELDPPPERPATGWLDQAGDYDADIEGE